MNRLTTNQPVVFTPIKPADLHQWWPLLERGLIDIRRKVETDHLPPDVYGAIRAEAAVACIVTRANHVLGFFIWHKQERPWSHSIDVFVWAGWALPIRERLPYDNIPEAVLRSIDYLHEIKRSIAAKRVVAISSRRGFIRRYGFKELSFTFEVTENGNGRGAPGDIDYPITSARGQSVGE